MQRKQILDLLAQYNPTDATEKRMRAQTILFVQENFNCFDRQLEIGHITGSAWVVNAPRTHVLLMHHRKLNRWLQPGGHADGEPDVLKVALNEAEEETGLQQLKAVSNTIFDVDVHEIPANAAHSAHLHYDIRFMIEADPAETLVINAESKDLQWVALSDIAHYNPDTSMTRMTNKTVLSQKNA